MPAYMVYVCEKVLDRKELDTYWSKIGPTLEGYGAKNVAAYTSFEQLEGAPVDGAAVIEFPSFDGAKSWYNSPAYQAIRHHRLNGARYTGLLMEGGGNAPDQRMPQTKDRTLAR